MPEKIVSNLVRNFVSEKSHKVCYNIPIMKTSASATARLSQSFRRTLYILTPPRLLVSKASHDTTYLLKKTPFQGSAERTCERGGAAEGAYGRLTRSESCDPRRAAFQDKTETDRGKRFDINGAKSAKEIFMREGYFRIEFYKMDGTADAEGAARVFGYCVEHCGDWFTGDFTDENDSA